MVPTPVSESDETGPIFKFKLTNLKITIIWRIINSYIRVVPSLHRRRQPTCFVIKYLQWLDLIELKLAITCYGDTPLFKSSNIARLLPNLFILKHLIFVKPTRFGGR